MAVGDIIGTHNGTSRTDDPTGEHRQRLAFRSARTRRRPDVQVTAPQALRDHGKIQPDNRS
jgi:hypothetical protein